MKKIFLSLSLMLTAAVTSVFAKEGPGIGEEVLTSFNKEFAGAQSVEWKVLDNYVKATFVLGDHRTVAYFDTNGELQGSIRALFYNQLPLRVMTAVDKKYADADVLDISEINNSNGTSYRITLEAQQKTYRIRVDVDGNITDTEKVKK
jgi:hypothetical protein